MSDKSCKKIHVFDPEIYPRKLFVLRGKDKESIISSEFETVSGDALDMDMSGSPGSATWKNVTHKGTGLLGSLVWIIDSRQKSKDMAHEAVHIVNGMFKELGIDMSYDHDEHYAYMVGWVTDCLIQVLAGKFKE